LRTAIESTLSEFLQGLTPEMGLMVPIEIGEDAIHIDEESHGAGFAAIGFIVHGAASIVRVRHYRVSRWI
jgi:hypothetical protein